MSKTTNCTRPTARAICCSLKNLPVLIYYKLHEKNHLITYRNNMKF